MSKEAMTLALETIKKMLIAHPEYTFTIKPVIKSLEEALKQEQGEPVAIKVDDATTGTQYIKFLVDECLIPIGTQFYTKPQPSQKPLRDEKIEDRVLSDVVDCLSKQHDWLTKISAINLVAGLYGRADKVLAAHGIKE